MSHRILQARASTLLILFAAAQSACGARTEGLWGTEASAANDSGIGVVEPEPYGTAIPENYPCTGSSPRVSASPEDTHITNCRWTMGAEPADLRNPELEFGSSEGDISIALVSGPQACDAVDLPGWYLVFDEDIERGSIALCPRICETVLAHLENGTLSNLSYNVNTCR
jgi:hypothetical protein